MKIVTRQPAEVVGNGLYTMKMNVDELQYLSAVLYVTRLGKGSPYRQAALQLINNVDKLFGDDFMEEAANEVNLAVTICDDEGNDIAKYPAEFVVVEV